jgi:hypothetical protein
LLPLRHAYTSRNRAAASGLIRRAFNSNASGHRLLRVIPLIGLTSPGIAGRTPQMTCNPNAKILRRERRFNPLRTGKKRLLCVGP